MSVHARLRTAPADHSRHPTARLPLAWLRPYDGADPRGFELSADWFAVLAATALEPGDVPVMENLPGLGAPAGMAMCYRVRRAGPFRLRTLGSLTGCYTTRFAPLGLEPAPEMSARVAAWAEGVRRGPGAVDRLLFEAMDQGGSGYEILVEGLRRAGWLVEPFPHFGNWYLKAEGLDFESYWSSRDGKLRSTVERKTKALEREAGLEIRIFRHADEVELAVALYETVYARSWKRNEPFPYFNHGLINALLMVGAGEVAVLLADGKPIAAQIWVFGGRRATIFKLAHDENWARHSPGSILTRDRIRAALDDGNLDEIDFGRGDDSYKRLWLPERRERWGLAAYNPTRPAGLMTAARNLGPKLLRNR